MKLSELLAHMRMLFPKHEIPDPPAELYVRYNGPLGRWDASEEQFPLESVRGIRVARYQLADTGKIVQVYETTGEDEGVIRLDDARKDRP